MKEIETTPESVKQLIRDGESNKVEFKSSLPPDDVIAMHISAFANTEGGIVLFGVGDKGTVLGMQENYVKSGLSRLSRISDALLPNGTDVGSVHIGGKTVLFLIVDPAPPELRPIMTSRGEVYVRKDDRIYRDKMLPMKTAGGSTLAPKPSVKHPTPGNKVIAFVAMSFRDEEEPSLVDYYKAMQRAAERTGLLIALKRIDLVEGDYEISQEIMNQINEAQIIIADFTLTPRNVYFEIGYARGKGHAVVIQTARKDTPLEFDVRNWKTIFYKNATELEEKLIPSMKDAYNKVIKKL